MDELELKRAINKGDQAIKQLESQKELWDDIEADLWTMWKKSKSDDVEGRESIYREHHAILAIQAKLKSIISLGKKAEEELKQRRVKHVNRNST